MENKIIREIMHFIYIIYMAMSRHKNSCSRCHEIYSFDKPFLGHHYFVLSLSDLCPGVENKIFMIDWIGYYNVSVILQPYNGGEDI